MNVAELGDRIIKTGICRYGLRQYRLFLCTSTFSQVLEIMRTVLKYAAIRKWIVTVYGLKI